MGERERQFLAQGEHTKRRLWILQFQALPTGQVRHPMGEQNPKPKIFLTQQP
jgi:hypothetical protein